jgi:hypothetical protein
VPSLIMRIRHSTRGDGEQAQPGGGEHEADERQRDDGRAEQRPGRERRDRRNDEQPAAGSGGAVLADEVEQQQRAADAGHGGEPDERADRARRQRDSEVAVQGRPDRHDRGAGRHLDGRKCVAPGRVPQPALQQGAGGEAAEAEQRPRRRGQPRRQPDPVGQAHGDPDHAECDADPLPRAEAVPAQPGADRGHQQRRGARDQGRRAGGHAGGQPKVDPAELHAEEQDAGGGDLHELAAPRPRIARAPGEGGEDGSGEDEPPERHGQDGCGRCGHGPDDVGAGPDQDESRTGYVDV